MRMAGEGEEEATCGDLFDDMEDLDFPVEHLHIAGDADLLPGESAGSWAAAGDKFPGFSFSDDDPTAARVLPEEGSQLDSWLSKFVEDSFVAGGGMVVREKSEFQTAIHVSELEGVSVTGPGNGESTPFAAVATPSRGPGKRRGRPPSTFLSSHDLLPGAKKKKKKPKTTAKLVPTGSSSAAPAGTKCMHCKATKTPQWRAGPLGPKTLCNACGVRFVSGRLFPEYRPSASPTFVPALHSNIHSKVLEMRVKSGQPAPAPVPFFGSKPNTNSFDNLPGDVNINTGTNSFLVIE